VLDPPPGPGSPESRAGGGDHSGIAARKDLALREADEGTPRGACVHSVRVLRSGGEHPYQPKLDPFGKIPEFKYCAVRISKGGAAPGDPGYGKGRTLDEMYG